MSLAEYYDTSYPPSLWDGSGGVVDPHINSLVPGTVSAAAAAATIVVNGTHFDADCVVEVDGAGQTTTHVSATRLSISYDPTAAATVTFTVRNSVTDKESNSVLFVVSTVTADDVSAMTVDDVKDFIREHPDLLAEVTELERHGKHRTTLLEWLQELLDEEDEEEDS